MRRSTQDAIVSAYIVSIKKRTPFMTEKIAVLAPIPSAKVRMATAGNPGDLRSMRSAKRTSCKNELNAVYHPLASTFPLIESMRPISIRAFRSACGRLKPVCILAAVLCSTKSCSSSFNSLSSRSFLNSARKPPKVCGVQT